MTSKFERKRNAIILKRAPFRLELERDIASDICGRRDIIQLLLNFIKL